MVHAVYPLPEKEATLSVLESYAATLISFAAVDGMVRVLTSDGNGNPVYGKYSNGNVRVINMHATGDYMMKYEYTDAHALQTGSISYNNYVGGAKSYLELSSSNVNHPNDFIHRLYAMNIMACLYDYPTVTYEYQTPSPNPGGESGSEPNNPAPPQNNEQNTPNTDNEQVDEDLRSCTSKINTSYLLAFVIIGGSIIGITTKKVGNKNKN